MNALQAAFLAIVAVLLLVGAGWLLRGCAGDEPTLEQAAAAEARAEAYLAQRDAARAEVARRDSLDARAAAREDSLARVSAEKDRANAALVADLRAAEAHVDELTGRFRETGDCEDCAAALDAHVVARAQGNRVIEGLSESLETKAELLLVKDERIGHLSVRGDSAIAALGYADLALAEKDVVIDAWKGQAEKMEWQRNAVLVGAGVVIVGILVFK